MKEGRVKALLNKITGSEFLRFAIVGVIATVIHYGIYLLLKNTIEVNISYTIGYTLSLLCNFYLSAKFTFKSDTSIKKGAGFIASHVINYILHIILLNAFISIGIPSSVAPLPVYCIAIPVNFILVRTVFRRL